MSRRRRPVWASTSWNSGTSISTPLVVLAACRSLADSAKPITATSLTATSSQVAGVGLSQVAGVGLERRVRLAGRPEALHVLRGRAPQVAGPPDRRAAHARPHPVG